MSEKHTIEQLREMSDEQLAELTARLRGYSKSSGGNFLLDESGNEIARLSWWNPAADIGQAYGLLVWLSEHGGDFAILSIQRVDGRENIVEARTHGFNTKSIRVPGNDARAMTTAFVLAMEAING